MRSKNFHGGADAGRTEKNQNIAPLHRFYLEYRVDKDMQLLFVESQGQQGR